MMIYDLQGVDKECNEKIKLSSSVQRTVGSLYRSEYVNVKQSPQSYAQQGSVKSVSTPRTRLLDCRVTNGGSILGERVSRIHAKMANSALHATFGRWNCKCSHDTTAYIETR
jgi:hypothetical protein